MTATETEIACVIDVAQDIRDRAADPTVLRGPWGYSAGGGALIALSVPHADRCMAREPGTSWRDRRPPRPGEVCEDEHYYGGHLLAESMHRATSTHLSVWTPEFATAVADLIDAALLGEAPDVAAAKAVRILMAQQPQGASA